MSVKVAEINYKRHNWKRFIFTVENVSEIETFRNFTKYILNKNVCKYVLTQK